ncbi:PhnD/SsuA/transferrin family substrate-binding protein [Rhodoplanes sp. Z2-YC6860]|uniref:PhnD/SsuA/transferrin family substrate-binding protein n=1 Tax=Rhodoplanes sp. Z2-YC6860 TaxID=674703 RepID=UPI00078C4DE4|nr:PhnD/SsuA/transferrin family substrate-binding protein [Rhodoplanes sp. Z2-YC6860]AMN44370.1 4,5-dihydroxyphthalate decarboxylase [Rhodoplanes sp. Z2-YC6860]
MENITLKLACWEYDRTRPLLDGRVRPQDLELDITLMRPQQAFQAMLHGREFDIAEMSLANYTSLKARGDCPFVAIPVMLSKMFRHSCIYVHADAGIRSPSDLKGKRAGTAQFTSTGVVFVKGVLEHEYGISQRDMSWWIGGLHKPVPSPQTLPNAPEGVSIHYLGAGQTLERMLKAGELDVLFSNHFPSLWLEGWPGIRRLFPDYRMLEQDYYKRTGIFPVMHTIVMREELHQRHPFVAASLYRAFCEAKDLAIGDLYDTDALRVTLPWLIDHVEEARRTLGHDYFSYGIDANRRALEAIGRYLYEQQIAPRIVTPEELFIDV